jgi:hypothetical protein
MDTSHISTKTCASCEQEFPHTSEHFYETGYTRKDGTKSLFKQCKGCFRASHAAYAKSDAGKTSNRRRQLTKLYGITLEQYDALHEAQQGKCKICQNECGSGRRLAVDHCHETGRVRGLLCVLCNTGIGKFRDNPALLAAAIEYLKNN